MFPITTITAHEALQALKPGTPVLFISDPTGGDQFIVNPPADHPVPATAEGSERTTAGDLLDRLDFAAYDEPPAFFVS